MSTTTPDQTEIDLSPEPARQAPAALFRYATWLHTGLGAHECPEVDEKEGHNTCGDAAHCHVWCRLPNQLQHGQIRERALAAKARKIRQLRDSSSDAYDILEEEFDRRARMGDSARQEVIDELLQIDWWRDYYAATQDVMQIPVDAPTSSSDDDDDDAEPEMRFAHVADDQARYRRLEAMAPADRPKDEWEELTAHLSAYQAAIDEKLEEHQAPKRSSFEAMDIAGLLDLLRDRRVDAEASREFQRVYDMHQWLSCTYRQPGGEPAFKSLEQLESAAPEVIEGLQATFLDLTRTAQEAQGN